MLDINQLNVQVEGQKNILKGLSLSVKPGEVHAIMGPNGSGKSTLSHVLAGKEGYELTSGSIEFQGQEISELSPEERAWKGLFLAFQYPVEIPGVNNLYFLRSALNSKRKYHKQDQVSAGDFLSLAKEKMKTVGLDSDFLNRQVNRGFSGGEKKRNEIFQMAMLDPQLCILDETDSGLDIDALKLVSHAVNQMRSPERSFVVITHYQRLLDYIQPDYVHVLADGQIKKSGDKTLAKELEQKGYDWVVS